MATTTTNLGLTKPAGTDAVDIAVINANMDKIDTAVAANTSDIVDIRALTELYAGNLNVGQSVSISGLDSYRAFLLTFGDSDNNSWARCSTIMYRIASPTYLPIAFGTTLTYVRIEISTQIAYLATGNAGLILKNVYGITKL